MVVGNSSFFTTSDWLTGSATARLSCGLSFPTRIVDSAIAQQKVQEQEQMIVAMNDMKMQSEILQHEQSKLKKLQSELDQAQSEVEQAQAKLSAAAIIQNQELEQLQTNVNLTDSELQLAKSKMETKK